MISVLQNSLSATFPLAMKSIHRPWGVTRRGISLLEVILAVAILGGALAAFGELFRIGAQNAQAARELTHAQLHCESLLAQIKVGALPAESVTPAQELPTTAGELPNEDWLYAVLVEPLDQEGLLAVEVTVVQNVPETSRPIEFTASAWIVDPEVIAVANEAEADAAAEAEASATEDSTAEPEGASNAPR